MSNSDRQRPDGLSSVDNALRLVQLIAERQVLRVADAADELGVARSTAHRLLGALRQRGFVAQDKPNGAYRPGLVLNDIAAAAFERLDIRRIARPILEQLREETTETASLLMLEGHNVRFIDCVESPRSVRVGTRLGLVLPAHCTAGGKAILAALPPSELARRYFKEPLESRTSASTTEWSELEGDLAETRRCGYAVNFGESEVGISAIGVALQDIIGSPLAGIAVAVPASRMATEVDAAALAPALLQAQATINDLLRPSS